MRGERERDYHAVSGRGDIRAGDRVRGRGARVLRLLRVLVLHGGRPQDGRALLAGHAPEGRQGEISFVKQHL